MVAVLCQGSRIGAFTDNLVRHDGEQSVVVSEHRTGKGRLARSRARQISRLRVMATSISIALVILALCIVGSPRIALAEAQRTQVRVGWQTLWATQGQLVMALKH